MKIFIFILLRYFLKAVIEKNFFFSFLATIYLFLSKAVFNLTNTRRIRIPLFKKFRR